MMTFTAASGSCWEGGLGVGGEGLSPVGRVGEGEWAAWVKLARRRSALSALRLAVASSCLRASASRRLVERREAS